MKKGVLKTYINMEKICKKVHAPMSKVCAQTKNFRVRIEVYQDSALMSRDKLLKIM